MKAVVFAVEEGGVYWLCAGVCGSGEVEVVGVFVEFEAGGVWDESEQRVVAAHGVCEGGE